MHCYDGYAAKRRFMLFETIQNNYVAFSIAVFLILFIKTNSNFEKRTNKFFLVASFCILTLIIEEVCEEQLSMKTVYQPLRVPLSVIGYVLRPVVPYCLVMIVRKFTKKQNLFLVMPLVCNLLISMSAFFCGAAFSYTADNQFHRGALGYAPFITAGIYVTVLLILNVKNSRTGNLRETLIVSAIVMLAIISTVMESAFHFSFIQNATMGVSVTFYYLFIQSNRNNRDPLTNALTRRKFYLDGEKYNSSISAVISLDLNNLKQLNDVYGHKEGDKALVSITQLIKKYMNRYASLYRIGGDEFMILCYRLSEKEVQEMIDRIQEDLNHTKYRCAFGYAMWNHEEDFDSVCQIADKMMYENKRFMKGHASKSQ